MTIHVNAFLVCDAATTEQGTGKHTIVGIFDKIFASGYPALHPRLTLFCKFRYDEQSSPQRAHVCLLRPTGVREHMPELNIATPGGSRQRSLVINVQGLTMHEPGIHEFGLVIDGAIVATADIEAVRVEAPGTQGGASNAN